MDRVFTADGPGVVTEIDSRQGVTWLCIEGAAFSGWYPGHEVTADIGDPGRVVTSPDEFPDKGAKLPYNPKPRDRFKNELNIQPIHDLPENLDPTNSVPSIRNHEPNSVFGARHPFAKQRNARHFAETDTTDDDKELDFDHVPGNWSEDNPGLTDYGPDYDAKNPIVVNPQDGWVRGSDGKFHHPVKNAEFVEGYPPAGWNDKGTPEELDNPFTREHDVIDQRDRGGGWGDHGEPEEYGDLDHAFEDDGEQSIDHPFEDLDRREAGWGEKFERFWLGDDYDWMNNITDTSQDQQHTQPFSSGQDYRPPTNDTHLDDRQLSYARTAAGVGMLDDTDADNMSNSTLIDPTQGLPDVEQVPWDPSHGVTPEGDMQVYSPDQQQNDVAGMLQNALGEGGDPLQGVEVPHQPDGDDELAGIPVPHVPGGGSLTPVGPGVEDPAAQVQVPEMVPGMPVGDADLAHMASEFMARTAGKNYTEGEQNLLMMEAGQASQLTALNLADSIYEDDDEGSYF